MNRSPPGVPASATYRNGGSTGENNQDVRRFQHRREPQRLDVEAARPRQIGAALGDVVDAAGLYVHGHGLTPLRLRMTCVCSVSDTERHQTLWVTLHHRPWSRVVGLEFADTTIAARFERYLKTGSGRAFAKRHFAAVAR